MPPRQKPKPESALVIGDPERGTTTRPPPHQFGGGARPDGANRISNADAGINTIGEGIEDTAKRLLTSEENQRILRKRREADRIQGAAEARADRQDGNINRWQFANSPNYRNETTSLFGAHYNARLKAVQAEIDRSSDPEYLKDLTTYLTTLRDDYNKQAKGIFAEDVEQDSIVQEGRASFIRTATAVQNRLEILGGAERTRLTNEILLDKGNDAEQRYELKQEVNENVANSYILDSNRRDSVIAGWQSDAEADYRIEQDERRKFRIEQEKQIVGEEVDESFQSLDFISRRLFVPGEDGEISTNGDYFTKFAGIVEDIGAKTLPAFGEDGEHIDEPFYREKALNKKASENIGNGLVAYTRKYGAGELIEKLDSQDNIWHEQRTNSDGTIEDVSFQLKPDITDRIRKADTAFSTEQLRGIVGSSRERAALLNSPIQHHPILGREERNNTSFILNNNDGGDLGRVAANNVMNTEAYAVAYEEARIDSAADLAEFAEGILDGSVIDVINSPNEELSRQYTADFILKGIDSESEKPDNVFFEYITGRPYPYSAEDLHKPVALRDALNYRNPQNADLETGIRHTEIITAEARAGAEVIASGFGIPAKRIKALISVAKKANGDEAILENVERLLQQTAELAVSEFGASEENIARGLAESLMAVREDNNNLTRIFFQGNLNGSSGGLAAQFYAYKEGILEIRENETEDIILARAEVRNLEFDNFSVESLKGGDPLWNVDSRASEFLKESLLQGIHNDELEEGRDYTLTEGGKISINHSAENMRGYFTNFFNGIKPLEQAPYQLRNSVGVIDAIPKMPLPQGVKDPGGRLRANAILNFAFASPTMQNSLVYQGFVSQIGEGAQEEIDKFRIAIRTRRNDSPAENMRIIPSEAGIEITYPTIEGVVRFPYILPWGLFDEFFYADTANK